MNAMNLETERAVQSALERRDELQSERAARVPSGASR